MSYLMSYTWREKILWGHESHIKPLMESSLTFLSFCLLLQEIQKTGVRLKEKTHRLTKIFACVVPEQIPDQILTLLPKWTVLFHVSDSPEFKQRDYVPKNNKIEPSGKCTIFLHVCRPSLHRCAWQSGRNAIHWKAAWEKEHWST